MNHFDLTDGLMWYFVFLYSTVCHEAAHAWAAMKLGDSTAHEGGQVSLDPTPHLRREPIGMVVVPILSYLIGGWMFGWASAPYDPEWAERHPRRGAWMAMAGPAANLALVLAALLGVRLGCHFSVLQPPETLSIAHLVEAVHGPWWGLAAALLSITFWLNLILFVFNLLPFPPLDGSNIPFFFLGHEAAVEYRRIVWNPVFRIIGFLVALRGFPVVFPIFQEIALHLLYPGIHYS
jgi:Zn-dependent protease